MRLLYFITALAFLSTQVQAQDVNITFRVKVPQAVENVYLVGDATGWAFDLLAPEDGSEDIYTLTKSFPQGTVTFFKYTTDNNWDNADSTNNENLGGSDCAWDGGDNNDYRKLEVGTTDEVLTLVCWNSCTPECGGGTSVKEYSPTNSIKLMECPSSELKLNFSQAGSFNVSVYSITGKLVLYRKVEVGSNDIINLVPNRQFDTGTYIVHILGDNVIETKKWIKR